MFVNKFADLFINVGWGVDTERMKKRSGFSLVELAMVLAISGLMVGFVLQANKTSNSTECVESARAQTKTIAEAIERFARRNDRLPLPAARNIGVENINYGREALPAAITQANGVSFGAVPFQALSLPVAMASDCWGNKLTYMVTTALTTNASSGGFLDTTVLGNMTLKASATVDVSTTIAYAIVSHGEDQLGAVKNNYAGVGLGWCGGASTMATMNCRATDAEVAGGTFNNGKDAGASYFDDIVATAGRPQILSEGSTGNLYCWGPNDQGQVGDGTTTERLVPTAVTTPVGVNFWRTFAEGGGVSDKITSCAIADNGNVYCWGDNADGQIGDGTTNDATEPTPIIKPVAVNYFTSLTGSGVDAPSCAIGDNGLLYCWGWGLTSTPTAIALPDNVTSVTAVTSSNDLLCIIGNNGRAYCRGHNSEGQLGDGTVSDHATFETVTMPAGVTSFVGISAGSYHACALANTGRAYCWGDNGSGIVGDGSTTDRLVPTAVTLPTGVDGFTKISTGGYNVCALGTNRRVYCWGEGSYGGMGNGTNTATNTTPQLVNLPVGVNYFTDISSQATNCAIGDNGLNYCWGWNNNGQVGDGANSNRNVPTAVTMPALVTSFSKIGNTCGIVSSTSNLYCWGNNTYGQIGDGSLENRLVPVAANLPTGVKYYTSFAQSDNNTCAIGDNGQAYCWGQNNNGQLGDGTQIDNPEPVNPIPLPAGVTSFTQITVGFGTTCAIGNNGLAYCWGAQFFIGDGSCCGPTLTPTEVTMPAGVTSFTKIAAGLQGVCAIGNDKMIYCWGGQNSGGLGNGSIGHSPTPTPVTLPYSVYGFTDVAAGLIHFCAIADSGNIYCWGGNTDGRLGDGSNTDRDVPTEISQPQGVTGWSQISLGAYSSCGLANDSKGYCWGDGWEGLHYAVGWPFTSYNTPQLMNMPAGVTGIRELGQKKNCFISTEGKSYCWSFDNANGMIGDNTTNNSGLGVAVSVAGGIGPFTSISTAGTSCGLVLPKTNMFCWGDNDVGQVGDDSGLHRTMPTPVPLPVGVSAFMGLNKSDGGLLNYNVNNCAVGNNGSAYCAGSNLANRIANNAVTNFTRFYKMTMHASSTSISALSTSDSADGSNCFLDSAGVIYCQGDGTYGGIGNGLTTDQSTPTPVTVPGPVSYFTQLSSGVQGRCAVANTGTVYCWGRGTERQNGNGAASNLSVPTSVTMPPTVKFTTVGRGYDHACALSTLGQIYCWGENGERELGNGGTVDSNVPILVPLPTGVSYFKTLSVGNSASCAIGSNNVLYCWGANSGIGPVSPPTGVSYFKNIVVKSVGLCGIGDDDQTYCWGLNDHGQLGDGTTTSRANPGIIRMPANTENFTDTNATCGIIQPSNAVCSGNNTYGELGDGTNISSLNSQYVKLPKGVTLRNISLGTDHSCGAGSNGRAYCWGNNENGALGDHTNAHRNIPTSVDWIYGNNGFVQVDAGLRGYVTAGLTSSGEVAVWGDAYFGDGTAGVSNFPDNWVTTPAGVTSFIDVSVGYATPCVLGDNGNAYCWGNASADGQMGNGDVSNAIHLTLQAVTMPADVTFTDIISGHYHTCALGNDGVAYCWGRNAAGAIGDGSTTNRHVPTAATMPSGISFTEIAVGVDATCAIGDDGLPYCWGYFNAKLFDTSISAGSTTPVRLFAPANITSFSNITVGYNSICAVANTGSTYCWGQAGSLTYDHPTDLMIERGFGNGKSSDAITNPTQAFTPAGLGPISAVAVGWTHMCAISTPTTNAYCAGNNNHGQLGNGTKVPSTVAQPVLMPSGVKLKRIMNSTHHSCGIGDDNQAYCWGWSNTDYAWGVMNVLGNGISDTTWTGSSIPVQVILPVGVTGWSDIAATNDTTCALANTGDLYCWGSEGLMGNGSGNTTQPTTAVTKPAGVTFWTEIAMDELACAIGSNGRAYCWGYGNNGTHGNGTVGSYYPTPEPVNLPSGVTSFSGITASNPNCAIGNNKRAYCWGTGSNGELGNGATVDSSVPVQVTQPAGTTGFKEISGTNNGVCAISEDDLIYCWGDGSSSAPSTPEPMPTGVTAYHGLVGGSNTSYGALGSNGRSYARNMGAVGGYWSDWGGNTIQAFAATRQNNVSQITFGASGQCQLSYPEPMPYCWGFNRGTFGDGVAAANNGTLTPTNRLPAVQYFTNVATAGYHTCFTGNNNRTYCTGGDPSESMYGQLGNGTTTDSTLEPTHNAAGLMIRPAGVTRFKKISVSWGNTCVIGDDDLPYCTGLNNNSQLGDGTTTDRLELTPVDISAIPATSFTDISSGNFHTCGIGNNGLAYCWGDNWNGELGDGVGGPPQATPIPTVLPAGVTTWSTIRVGGKSTCAIAATGANAGNAYCWGTRLYGRIGDGTPASGADYYTPRPVTMPGGGVTFLSLSMGVSHTCAIGSNGSGYCWGRGANHRLGKGATTNSLVPTLVTMPANTTFTEIAAGDDHTCALSSGKRIYCWGDNTDGKLGDGTTTNRSTPTAALMPSGITGFTQLSVNHLGANCAIPTRY